MGGRAAPGALTDQWDFTYDGDGTRTVQLYTQYLNGQPQPIATTRYYFGGAYETTNGAWKKYYSFGGTTLMRDASGFKYFLSDQLGSVAVVLSDTGAVLEQQRYLPFGQARLMPPYASITSTDLTYTGQRNIAGTGLMDYNARFYSALGRFVQPDSIIPGIGSQSFNRFSYVINNPLRYTDPTGHKWDECKEGQSDYLCKQHMKRVDRLKTRWKAEENARKAAVRRSMTLNGIFGGTVGLPSVYGMTGGGTGNQSSTSTPTSTPTVTATPSTIQTALSYLQYSPLGQASYNYLVANGIGIEYNTGDDKCSGHSGNPILVPDSSCSGASPADVVGTMTHEVYHLVHPELYGTLLGEYQAYLAGDLSINELIQAGIPNASPRHALSTYNVNLNNPDKAQLGKDLTTWFNNHQPQYVTDKAHGGYGVLPAFSKPSWWSWLTGH